MDLILTVIVEKDDDPSIDELRSEKSRRMFRIAREEIAKQGRLTLSTQLAWHVVDQLVLTSTAGTPIAFSNIWRR